MSISIVSAPASSTTQASSANSAGSADSSTGASGQDFISLLFGQLFATPETTPANPAETVSEDKTADTGEDAQENGTDALLASLSVAIPGMRNDIVPAATPPALQQTADDGIVSDKTAKPFSALPDQLANTSDKALAARAEASGDAQRGNADPSAGDPKAANFAVPSAALPNEQNAATQKGTPTSATEQTSPSIALPSNLPAATAGRETQTSVAIPASLHDQRWNTDFSQKIVWLASQQKQSAEITLNPPHLGNIEVSLRIDSSTNTATASFVSANADVRESIESALPRLREMFAHAGISLGQTNVSAESFRQAGSQWNGANGDGSPSHWGDDNAILEPELSAARSGQVLTGSWNGLVDTFV